ncbi:hypothetical protein PFICI_11830 [Pestalotiopsis fici W106-1]|uniref:Zeta toxin domain-containing protein n=1 Tax=Pestalotiopsis fici (strain W106-1 / CGMCC3.15140) TaxID=1229662 RepID=W3WRG4_PESFW|nr:uncharacterized protein PFICI_11830 [Pestalotiopsis fici W106-1]ETS76443.1 hypothetical protein PFICI_11830 [Pestalotiopsis fici W106-1]
MAVTESYVESFKLSDAESRRIFLEQIVPKYLGHLQSPDNVGHEDRPPLAVFIIGQLGAGKTRAAPTIKQVMQGRRGEPAHLIANKYKEFHSSWEQLLSEKPMHASMVTKADDRAWLAMGVAHAMERRADVLAEMACRFPEDFCELTQTLHDAGYRVEVMILAVPEALSWIGVLTRYNNDHLREREQSDRSWGLPQLPHDETCANLVNAARFVDESSAVDQVVVVRRGNLVAYTNEKVNGSWVKKGSAVDALLFERNCGILPAEQRAAEEDIKELQKDGSTIPKSSIPEIGHLTSFFDITSDERQLRDLALPRISTANVRFGTQVDLSLGLDIP